MTYTPDFYLPRTDRFIEIKGWIDKNTILKWDILKEQYPEINLTLVMGDWLKDHPFSMI